MNFYNMFMKIISKKFVKMTLLTIILPSLVAIIFDSLKDFVKKYVKKDDKEVKENNNLRKRIKNYIKVFVILWIIEIISLTILSIISTFSNRETENGIATNTISDNTDVEKNKRYNIYDEKEISEKIKLINKDLEKEGKQIDENKLKAFIYGMNGDYSLCSSSDILIDILNIYTNINIDSVSIIRGFYINIGEMSPINSLANIFANENDFKVVLYWQDYYNDFLRKIYEESSTGINISEIDNFCIQLREFFMNRKCGKY